MPARGARTGQGLDGRARAGGAVRAAADPGRARAAGRAVRRRCEDGLGVNL